MYSTYSQRGSILPASIIFLIVLMGLLLSSTRDTNLQLKMSHSATDQNWSFQAAEAAVADAENWLFNLASHPDPEDSCSAQPCVLTATSWIPEDQTHSWWTSDTNAAEYSNTLGNITTPPRYVIEYIKFVSDNAGKGHHESSSGTYFYRITARATGGTDNTSTIIQTTYAKRY